MTSKNEDDLKKDLKNEDNLKKLKLPKKGRQY